MELAFRQQDLDFRDEVRNFIDQYWPGLVRGAPGLSGSHHRDRSPEAQVWFDALVSRGWSVPHWPVEHGGTGWTPTRKFIWDREAARAEVPQMSVFATSMLGPLLCRWGNPTQQSEFLAPIREARVAWCQGHSTPEATNTRGEFTTTAVRRDGHYLVNAEMVNAATGTSVAADWMFCPVRTRATSSKSEGISLLLIDMRSPGITLQPTDPLAAGLGVNKVTLTNVRVLVGNRVGRENHGWTCAKGLLNHERGAQLQLATSRLQLQRVGEIAAQTPADGGSVADGEVFQRKYRELEVELLGLETLELRMLADVEAGRAATPVETVLSTVLSIRGTAVDQRLADLTIETLGYYALPYPDEMLIDNEGAIGHDGALNAVQRWLSSHAWGSEPGQNETQKDTIASSALGL